MSSFRVRQEDARRGWGEPHRDTLPPHLVRDTVPYEADRATREASCITPPQCISMRLPQTYSVVPHHHTCVTHTHTHVGSHTLAVSHPHNMFTSTHTLPNIPVCTLVTQPHAYTSVPVPLHNGQEFYPTRVTACNSGCALGYEV